MVSRHKRAAVDPNQLTMVGHLRELRTRLIISVVGITVFAVLGYIIYPEILSFLMHPLCSTNGLRGCKLYITGPFDGFAIRVKLAAYFGLFAASPLVLWEVWKFISPGLRGVERRYGIAFVVSSVTLFIAGAAVAYLVYGRVLNFLEGQGGSMLHEIYTPSNYLSFLLILMLAFGVSFLFPVVLTGLELAGAVDVNTLRKKRRVAWFAIIIIVAVFIPSSDPYSLTAMTVPLLGFYEISIVIGRIAKRRAAKRGAIVE